MFVYEGQGKKLYFRTLQGAQRFMNYNLPRGGNKTRVTGLARYVEYDNGIVEVWGHVRPTTPADRPVIRARWGLERFNGMALTSAVWEQMPVTSALNVWHDRLGRVIAHIEDAA